MRSGIVLEIESGGRRHTSNSPCQIITVDPAEDRKEANEISLGLPKKIVGDILADPFIRSYELGLIQKGSLTYFGTRIELSIAIQVSHRNGQEFPAVAPEL